MKKVLFLLVLCSTICMAQSYRVFHKTTNTPQTVVDSISKADHIKFGSISKWIKCNYYNQADDSCRVSFTYAIRDNQRYLITVKHYKNRSLVIYRVEK